MIISNRIEALFSDHSYFVDICGQLTANFAAYYPHTNKTPGIIFSQPIRISNLT